MQTASTGNTTSFSSGNPSSTSSSSTSTSSQNLMSFHEQMKKNRPTPKPNEFTTPTVSTLLNSNSMRNISNTSLNQSNLSTVRRPMTSPPQQQTQPPPPPPPPQQQQQQQVLLSSDDQIFNESIQVDK